MSEFPPLDAVTGRDAITAWSKARLVPGAYRDKVEPFVTELRRIYPHNDVLPTEDQLRNVSTMRLLWSDCGFQSPCLPAHSFPGSVPQLEGQYQKKKKNGGKEPKPAKGKPSFFRQPWPTARSTKALRRSPEENDNGDPLPSPPPIALDLFGELRLAPVMLPGGMYEDTQLTPSPVVRRVTSQRHVCPHVEKGTVEGDLALCLHVFTATFGITTCSP